MLSIIIGVLTRIVSNSYLNVFQKLLTNNGERPSVVNFYTYLGLGCLSLLFLHNLIFSTEILFNVIIMGVLGSLGNYYIIKALSCGELSTLAPINSYKPVVALVFGIFLLHEIPTITDLIGILLIIAGTLFLTNSKFIFSKACFYRVLALIFSGTEAIFIKKVILLSDISSAFFYWALAGLIFAFIIALKHPLKITKANVPSQICLVLMVGLMQYSTNYVFSKINVAHALALFQLSTILSVFLGVNIFKENDLIRKLIASIIMLIGAILVIHPV